MLPNAIEILIVEDDSVVREMATTVAEKRGLNVVSCESAEEAQLLWKENQFPLILLDLHLPKMDGEEFCKWIRNQPNGEDTFVIVATADTNVKTFHRVLSAGANDYVPKPFHPQLLAIRLDVANSQIRQIAKKKAFQAEVFRNEKRFRLISENSRDLVCTHQADGSISYISPSSKNLLGYDPEELIGRNFDELKLDPNTTPINLQCGEDESNGQLETTNTWNAQRKDKKEIWLETYTQATKNLSGGLVEIYSYSRDITEQKNEERQLQILKVLGEDTDSEAFLKAILHEIETHLDASAVLHIHPYSRDRISFSIHTSKLDEDSLQFHKELNRETNNELATFQSKNANGVFNQLKNSESWEAIICEPVPGTYGRSIGKITICAHHPINESERTKAILSLCASRIGCVLESHVLR